MTRKIQKAKNKVKGVKIYLDLNVLTFDIAIVNLSFLPTAVTHIITTKLLFMKLSVYSSTL